ncbi:hypothetical protein UFOVP623_42 [uncultured Caudovirales phage]|uniref:Uncharacterized protein n=1 Tax=uncultured Caudovirales phage TaxID=2100421 RepID=A0A6J5N5V1_9CAUD|nr:hypothetical protein UFOVP623_42 [uncultured Caudovirales phage]
MRKSQKFISMAEAVSNLEKNPKMQEVLAEIKRKREVSPARHARQFSLELMNISMELNGRCQIIGWCTQGLLDNSRSMEDRKEFLARRREEVLLVTDLQVRHDKIAAELDQAIIDEDAQKVS